MHSGAAVTASQATEGKRLRVLAIAEAANPEWVSVPLVGWSLAKALMARHDVHLVTQIRNRDAILRAGLIEGRDFTAIDSEAVARPVYQLAQRLRMGEGKGWTLLTALSSKIDYPHFERLVWAKFGPDIRAGKYDVVHRITPLSLIANSSLAAKCEAAGVPFVMGPLNGGVPWPKGFDAERKAEGEWLSPLRGLHRFMPGRAKMLSAARAVIVGSRFAKADLPADIQHKVALIAENAIDPARFNLRPKAFAGQGAQEGQGGLEQQDGQEQSAGKGTPANPLRACFIGRLVPCKGTDMLLHAAAPLLKSGRMTLDLLGNGPEEGKLHQIARDLQLGDSVTFHGWVDHHAIQNILQGADIFTFPSFREFGGGVVLEAMALGVVPIVCDYAGPAELVDARTGFKIPVTDREGLTHALRDCLTKIADAPEQLIDMSRAAHARVQDHFTWDQKARQITAIYDWAMKPQGPIPQPVLTAGQSHN